MRVWYEPGIILDAVVQTKQLSYLKELRLQRARENKKNTYMQNVRWRLNVIKENKTSRELGELAD